MENPNPVKLTLTNRPPYPLDPHILLSPLNIVKRMSDEINPTLYLVDSSSYAYVPAPMFSEQQIDRIDMLCSPNWLTVHEVSQLPLVYYFGRNK